MRIRDIIREGGNVFAGQTAPIARENIQPTLERYFQDLSKIFPHMRDQFNLNTFVMLGSAGKKAMSGDIDLGVDVSSLIDQDMSGDSIQRWGIDPQLVDQRQEAFAKRARTATAEQLRMRAFLVSVAEKINSSGTDIHVEEKKTGAGGMFCLYPQYDAQGQRLGDGVQIDWMVGNLQWLSFSYYSSEYPAASNVKGLHRTQLMLSAFQVANMSFDHTQGVRDKETREVLATNPEEALGVLNQALGTTLDRETVENYYSLHKALKSQLSGEQYSLLLDIYFKILDRTRTDIPDDLQDDWVARRERLGLKGKFLPDSSQLAKYRVTEGALAESGVTGADRVASREDFGRFIQDYQSLISDFPGFQGMEPTGSYNSDLNKQDFGDIDLIVHITSDQDKAQVKRELVTFLQAQPETVVVPFTSAKHTGKRTYNAGELVSVRFHSEAAGYSAQIDNIIALSPSEANYKRQFLDFPAPVQGLILGLVKVAAIETPPGRLFQKLGISQPVELPEDQEWEFNISPVELQLRRVTYDPGTTRQVSREVVWSSRDMKHVQALLYQYDLTADFESLLQQAERHLRNPRSGPRIRGLFRSMITVKSGEVGTPKAAQKEQALAAIQNAGFPE